MSKYFWALFWIIFGIFVCILSSISDTLVCSKDGGYCIIQSKISFLNKIVSEDRIPVSEIKDIKCIKTLQPSKSGKKSYFTLKLSKMDETVYNLGSYQKFSICKEGAQPIKMFLKGRVDAVTFSSGSGFVNTFGYIFGVIMFVISIVILTSKEESIEDSEEN